jgi:hypothetical protein
MPTIGYVPTRTMLWRRTLVRQFWVPRRRWTRLAVGPGLVLAGFAVVSGSAPMELSPLGLLGGALVGIGLGWTLWPFAGAWLAVTRSPRVLARVPVRLTVEGGALELVRGEERLLFALADLERVDRLAGERWLRFKGERWVVVPDGVSEGDAAAFLAAIPG